MNSDTPSWWREFGGDLLKVLNDKPPFRRSIGVLVGVSEYDHFQKLDGVATDLLRMREYLLGAGAFDVVFELSEKIATRQRVEDFMCKDLPAMTREGDRILFYFSGHGQDVGGGSGYMCLRGAELRDPVTETIEIARAKEWSNFNSKASHIAFLFDCCASGVGDSLKGPGDSQSALRALSGKGSRAIFTAGTGEETAIEFAEGNVTMSLFTFELLRVLNGKNQTKRSDYGFWTLQEAVECARESITVEASKHGKSMTPRAWILPDSKFQNQGAFVLADGGANAEDRERSLSNALRISEKDPKRKPSPDSNPFFNAKLSKDLLEEYPEPPDLDSRFRVSSGAAKKGMSGADGQDGDDGDPGGHPGASGKSGEDGGPGGDGEAGSAGVNCANATVIVRQTICSDSVELAEITVKQNGPNSVHFYHDPKNALNLSFVGGRGGGGGKGGKGGKGGSGGVGYGSTSRGGKNGNGGGGGAGGAGGQGGRGGDGGAGAIIMLTVEGDEMFRGRVDTWTQFDLVGGGGGTGGPPGTPGTGGAGALGGYDIWGGSGTDGHDGKPGHPGVRGEDGSNGGTGHIIRKEPSK